MSVDSLHPPESDVVDFLREAHVRGWPDGVTKIRIAGHEGFEQTTYHSGSYSFVDLYRGATTDVGIEVIFWHGRQIWGAVYRGGISVTGADIDAIFGFLINALRARPPDALPIRGPRSFTEAHSRFLYRHELRGAIASFSSVEQIHADGAVVYERITIGGWSGDEAPYGAPVSLPSINVED